MRLVFHGIHINRGVYQQLLIGQMKFTLIILKNICFVIKEHIILFGQSEKNCKIDS